MNYTSIVLIITGDKKVSSLIKTSLSDKSINVIFVDSIDKSQEILKKAQVSVVVLDLNPKWENQNKLLMDLKRYSPHSKLIVLSEQVSINPAMALNQTGAIKYLKKPFAIEDLKNIILKTAFHEYTSNIVDVELTDFLHVLSLSKKNKLLSVTNPSITNLMGLIYLEDGILTHAEYGNLEGEKALSKILAIKNGFFYELPWNSPESATINKTINEIIMDNKKDTPPSENNEGKKTLNILVVDNDPITKLIITEFLMEKEFNVYTATSVFEGSEVLQETFIDLVITELEMPEVNGVEFLFWINKYSPRTQVIITTSSESPEIKSFVKQHGAIKFFVKPLVLEELYQFIKSTMVGNSFSGQVKFIGLYDFIKILIHSNQQKLITVNNLETEDKGLIYIEDGRVIHSLYTGNFDGEEAYFKILKIKNGIFFDLPMKTDKITITKSFSELDAIYQKINMNDYEKPKIPAPPQLPPIAAPGQSLIKINPNQLKIEKARSADLINLETDLLKKLTIFEAGVAMGITIGQTSKQTVLEIMKQFSSIDNSQVFLNRVYFYDDLSVNIIFDDHSIVEEIRFDRYYKGATTQGLRLGDSISKAIKLYGEPDVCTIKGAVWGNMAIYCLANNTITSIRLRDSDIFEKMAEKSYLYAKPQELLNSPENNEEAPDEKKLIPEPDKNEKVLKEIQEENELNLKEIVKEQLKHLKDIAGKSEPVAEPQKLLINEEGEVMGITINKTTREEVKSIMQNYSESFNFSQSTNNLFIYNDLSFKIQFDPKGIVKELNFGHLYRGFTKKGLAIGDTLEKAIELYGSPRFKNSKNVFWKNMAVFCEDTNIITEIRLFIY